MVRNEVKYSVCLCNHDLGQYDKLIENWLSAGIKVYWFGTQTEKQILDSKYEEYVKHFLMQSYVPEKKSKSFMIIDGKEIDTVAKEVLQSCEEFNFEQYVVEHAVENENIIVEAGAGTGKTTVMVNRILFLLHTVKEISVSEIAMITFTNEATQNMRKKLQENLLVRFRLTGNKKYVEWMEQVPQMQINTIHSFSKQLVSELGVVAGYGNNVSLRSFKYEKRQIIRDLLDELKKEHPGKVQKAFGLSISDIEKTADRFWNQIDNLGMTNEDILSFDWGDADDQAKALNRTLEYLLKNVKERYEALKKQQNAISIKDIVSELRSLLDDDTSDLIKTMKLRYLFVDEFQDTDNVQIQMVAWLKRVFDMALFVVGDVKQSIYRFRGAEHTAFNKLKDELGEEAVFSTYGLNKNYRTSVEILEPLHGYFWRWKNNKKELLHYDTKLLAQNKGEGTFQPINVLNKREQEQEIVNTIQTSLKRLAADKNKKKDDRVMLLVRTNKQIQKIVDMCERHKIACYARKEGQFYKSDAVIEFYSMVGAFLYSNVPKFQYNYLKSSYVKEIFLDMDKLQMLNGETSEINKYMREVLQESSYEEYLKKFRLEPTICVLREIVEECNPVKNYFDRRRKELLQESQNADEIKKRLQLEVMQYRANLNRLMEIIRQNFSGDFVSLYQVYNFLQINITTNREEDDVDITNTIDTECVHCTTVHKSKGLEYHTVIIPYTDRPYRQEKSTEILIEEQQFKIGWSLSKSWDDFPLKNQYYDYCAKKENDEVEKEEARLLYVALTRAKQNLICIVYGKVENCWARLLKEK